METAKKSFGEAYFDSFIKKAILPGVAALVFTLAFVREKKFGSFYTDSVIVFDRWHYLLFAVLCYVAGVIVLKFSNFDVSLRQCAKPALVVPGLLVGIPLAVPLLALFLALLLVLQLIWAPFRLWIWISDGLEARRYQRFREQETKEKPGP